LVGQLLKKRTKIFRKMKNPQCAETVMQGIIIFYNFVWLHRGIGNTPAKEAGIDTDKYNIKQIGDLIDLAFYWEYLKKHNG